MTALLLWAEVLEAAAHCARELAAAEKAERGDWVDQRASALGSRRHCAAVRRRLAKGEPGAAVVGRRHLLSAESLAEELRGLKGPRRSAGPESVGSELRRALSLVGGARG